MKKLLFCLTLFPLFINGQNLVVSDAIAVSPDGTGSRAPHIALLEGSRPVVYWGKTGSNPKIYISVWEDGAFTAPVDVNTNGIEADLWGSGLGPNIAAQGNLIFIVFESYGEGIFCVKSDDDGQTFGLPVSVWDAPPGRVGTLPAVAIDPAGNPIISFVSTNFSEQEAQYEITKSADGGASFPPTTLANDVTPGDEVCECCPASIITPTEDEVYLGFRNNDNNLRDIWVAQSTDGNASFTAAADIDETDWITFSCPTSGPKLLNTGGQIHAAYFSAASEANIYYSSLNPSNMEAGDQYQLMPYFGQNNVQSHPSIAGNGDTLAVIWQEIGDNGYDIVMAWSANGPAGLTQNSALIDGGPTSQKHSDIIFGGGLFHIVYEDSNTGKVMYRTAGFSEMVNTTELADAELSIAISPSPATDRTLVTFNNQNGALVTAQLYDTNGKVLRQYKSSGSSIELDCSSMSSGV